MSELRRRLRVQATPFGCADPGGRRYCFGEKNKKQRGFRANLIARNLEILVRA